MKFATTILVAIFAVVALVNSLPALPDDRSLRSQLLERLVMAEGENSAASATALRSKRTIGILRQLFPGLTQIVERKVNAITSEVTRILGPIVLRSVLGGGGGVAGGGNEGRTSNAGTTVEVASPFGDDDDNDDDGDDGDKKGDGNGDASSSNNDYKLSANSKNGARVSIQLPTYPPDEEELDRATESSPVRTTTIFSLSNSNFTKSSSSDVNAEAEDRLSLDTAESQNNQVRVQFADDQASVSANEAVESELAPLEDIELSDDENRNKRFLNFGFGGGAGASGSGGAGGAGSGGGSGNILFDLIRQAADGAARAAGTVYRVVAGTQSLGLGLSASRDVSPAPASAAPAPNGPDAGGAPGSTPTPAAAPAPGNATQPPLVAGSGSSQQGDVAAGAPSPGQNDGTTEAVPGPVTRLFVIANRGISNLIQDLILRLAATSERIVNFKARLITSII